MDRRTIYDRAYYQMAFDAAKETGVSCQAKQAVAGGNDAGAIHVSRGGVRTVAVSLPCRYLHSAVSLISQKDFHEIDIRIDGWRKRLQVANDCICRTPRGARLLFGNAFACRIRATAAAYGFAHRSHGFGCRAAGQPYAFWTM